MANRYYTLLIIPEKTSQVRRIVLPSWIVKGSVMVGIFFIGIAGIMMVDYWYVMDQIDQTKELKLENRRLVQEVQVFKNKMSSLENALDRIQTFATRLRVITNIEDKEAMAKRLTQPQPPSQAVAKEQAPPETSDLHRSMPFSPNASVPDEIRLKKDKEELDLKIDVLSQETYNVENELQDLYELLIDQKNFLAALPTRRPTIGYITSGFGIRESPYGGGEKMHEGLDIANYPGTPIVATAYGVVTFSGRRAGYGKTVIVDHGYGIETWYAHANELLVREGQKVRRGIRIAKIGSTGRSTGPHVHYEVRVNGIPVDPRPYILED